MVFTKIIAFSIFQALLSTLVAVILGFASAYYVAKKKSLFADILVSFSAVPLCVPPLLVALGYVLFFGNNGSFNRFLMAVFNLQEAPFSILYSFSGIIIAHGFYNFPIIMKAVADVWQRLPEEEEWAASLLGASRFRLFKTISFAHLRSPLASAASIVFLYCFFSFIIVLLFGPIGLTTLEVEVYRASRLSLDFSKAAFFALIETIIALAIVYFYSSFEKSGLRSQGTSAVLREKTKMGLSSRFFSIVLFGLISIFFLFPLFSIPIKAVFTKAAFKTVFFHKSFLPALGASLQRASISALLATSFAFVYALCIRIKDPLKKNRFFRFFPFIPMAISSVVLGFIITSLLFALRLQANLFILSLCQAFLFWPFAFRQIQFSLDAIPQAIDEVALILSPSLLYRILKIYLPLLKTGLVSALSFSFAMSLGDASLPLLLAIPNIQTLSLFTYRLAGSYRFAEACASGSIILVLSVFVFYIGERQKKNLKREKKVRMR